MKCRHLYIDILFLERGLKKCEHKSGTGLRIVRFNSYLRSHSLKRVDQDHLRRPVWHDRWEIIAFVMPSYLLDLLHHGQPMHWKARGSAYMIMRERESDSTIFVVISFSANPFDHLLVFRVFSLLDWLDHLICCRWCSKWAKSGVEKNNTLSNLREYNVLDSSCYKDHTCCRMPQQL